MAGKSPWICCQPSRAVVYLSTTRSILIACRSGGLSNTLQSWADPDISGRGLGEPLPVVGYHQARSRQCYSEQGARDESGAPARRTESEITAALSQKHGGRLKRKGCWEIGATTATVRCADDTALAARRHSPHLLGGVGHCTLARRGRHLPELAVDASSGLRNSQGAAVCEAVCGWPDKTCTEGIRVDKTTSASYTFGMSAGCSTTAGLTRAGGCKLEMPMDLTSVPCAIPTRSSELSTPPCPFPCFLQR